MPVSHPVKKLRPPHRACRKHRIGAKECCVSLCYCAQSAACDEVCFRARVTKRCVEAYVRKQGYPLKRPNRQTQSTQATAGPQRTDWARLDWAGAVAVLTLDRPPTNALSAEFCRDIGALIAQALDQDHAAGLVICSDLAGFSSGADVTDLLDPPAMNRASLAHLCRTVSQSSKPIVAAIHGACLSTGSDLALAAHARIAGPQARIGFPDLRLGLLPAGGGIYRATRLLGAKLALDMMLNSKAIPSEEALDIGLVDQVCAAGDEVTQAVAMVLDMTHAKVPSRRNYLAHLRADMAAVQEVRAKMPALNNPWVAQHRLVDCVEAALLLPEDSALSQEAVVFDEVQRGPIAQALSYAFIIRERVSAASKSAPQTAESQQHATRILRQVMAQVVDHFQDKSLVRHDILAALAAFGVGLPAGSALVLCPNGAEDVMPALLAAWANAGAHMLRTGIVQQSYEIDFAAISAGMCPNWQGGPMYLADKNGATRMRQELARRAAGQDGKTAALFAPDPLWDTLIANGLRLSQYQA